MKEANELRIGNYVYPNEENASFWQVAGIQGNHILFGYGKGSDDSPVSYKDIQPIPLTPEILEKCGFEKKDKVYNKYFSDKNDWLFLQYFEDNIEFIYEDAEGEGTSLLQTENIINLHQLQNLYFALTGNELEINL